MKSISSVGSLFCSSQASPQFMTLALSVLPSTRFLITIIKNVFAMVADTKDTIISCTTKCIINTRYDQVYNQHEVRLGV